jgi:DNA-directed RNA polymerase I, II, and III subunit RPABC2
MDQRETTVVDYSDIMANYDPKKNKTKNILSKYEKVKILGVRTEQLQRGAEPLIKWEGEFDPRRIAKEELAQRKTPFMIRRKLPDGTLEYFRLEDMIIL